MISKTDSPRSHIYGPVPSRRLGFSLGVDIIPFKTCTLDCIYCQLGPTPEKRNSREEFYTVEEITTQIRDTLASGRQIDSITFSGSGEPTLNTMLGELIREVKTFTDIPVTVLTNATLLPDPAVQEALLAADRIVPSLDAAAQDVFERINRPAPGIRIEDIIDGLAGFRKRFSGEIWLEILLVKGINDSEEHLRLLKTAAEKIGPDRIQINTVVRPPSDAEAKPLSKDRLEEIRSFFGDKAEIIAEFSRPLQTPVAEDLTDQVLAVIRRRPVTLDDLVSSLGMEKEKIKNCLEPLLAEKAVQEAHQGGRIFYKPA